MRDHETVQVFACVIFVALITGFIGPGVAVGATLVLMILS